MNWWLQCEFPSCTGGVVLFRARVQGAWGQALPADMDGAPGGPGVLSLPTIKRGHVLCHGPPRHRWGPAVLTLPMRRQLQLGLGR